MRCAVLLNICSFARANGKQFDANSTGPPPATSVLVLGLSALIPNQHLRRHFGAHGTILSFEPQIDKSSGGALGIVRITFSSHDEAKACVTKEHGKKLALTVPGVNDEGEDLRVVFDGEGKLLKAVMGELDRRRLEKRKREKEEKEKTNVAHLKHTPTSSASQTPVHANNPWRITLRDGGLLKNPQHQHQPHPLHPSHGHSLPPHASRVLPQNPHLPLRPQGITPLSMSNSPVPDKNSPLPSNTPTGPRHGPASQARRGRPVVPVLGRGTQMRAPVPSVRPPISFFPNGSTGMPVLPPGFENLPAMPVAAPVVASSRSPSPVGAIGRRPGQRPAAAGRQVDYEAVKAELARNGLEHIAIDGQVGGVQEQHVRAFLGQFQIDQVCGYSFVGCL